MNAPVTIQKAHCPYCTGILFQSLKRHQVASCLSCKRPIVIARSPLGRQRLYRIHSVLDAGMTIYALLTTALIAFFVATGYGVGGFVKGFSIALFIVGSVLCVDGVLGIRTARDKSLGKQRRGGTARAIGAGKVVAGLLAFSIVALGISL